eukprot:scaffold24472_cov76-Attheya_sp.AAC.6
MYANLANHGTPHASPYLLTATPVNPMSPSAAFVSHCRRPLASRLIRYHITLGNDIVLLIHYLESGDAASQCRVGTSPVICGAYACGMCVCQATQAMDATCNAIAIE